MMWRQHTHIWSVAGNEWISWKRLKIAPKFLSLSLRKWKVWVMNSFWKMSRYNKSKATLNFPACVIGLLWCLAVMCRILQLFKWYLLTYSAEEISAKSLSYKFHLGMLFLIQTYRHLCSICFLYHTTSGSSFAIFRFCV